MENAEVKVPQKESQDKIVCPICGRKFYSNDFYQRHVRLNHPREVSTSTA